MFGSYFESDNLNRFYARLSITTSIFRSRAVSAASVISRKICAALPSNSRSTPIPCDTRVPDRRAPHPRLVPRHSCKGYIGHIQALYGGPHHWPGRLRFISARTAIGRRWGTRLFAFRARNDVLRVSAYMQPSDRAWQIGSARVWLHVHRPPRGVYIGSSPPKVEDISGGVELLASQMGLHHAALPRANSKGLSTPFLPLLHSPPRLGTALQGRLNSSIGIFAPSYDAGIVEETGSRGTPRFSR